MKQFVESTLRPGIKTTATAHLCMPNLPAFPLSSSYHMRFFKCLTGTMFVKCFTGYFCHLFLMLVHLPPLSLSSLLTLNTPPRPHRCSISSISRPALTNHSASKPGGGVKKVTGVGGTTYEISVWAADLLHGVPRGGLGHCGYWTSTT